MKTVNSDPIHKIYKKTVKDLKDMVGMVEWNGRMEMTLEYWLLWIVDVHGS
jgi:hypothetical protein